ncbi:hypothetical protein, partial [Parasaccharibacter sp. TMW 2.1884]|uniref:hypothetical protein n=1 Tax=Parasaccharibacter sp. TMW 2.1884 TaxID=2267834 RepID=UPI0020116172
NSRPSAAGEWAYTHPPPHGQHDSRNFLKVSSHKPQKPQKTATKPQKHNPRRITPPKRIEHGKEKAGPLGKETGLPKTV